MRRWLHIAQCGALCCAFALPASAQEQAGLPGGWTLTTRLPRLQDVSALACSEQSAAARSWSGAVFVFDGRAWRALPEIPGATRGRTYGRQVAITSSGEVYVTVTDGVAVWDGSTWSVLALPEREQHSDLGDVAALPDGGVYVVGRARIWRRDGARFSAHDAGTWRDLSAVTGTSAADLWVSGQGGTVMHWDGHTWTRAATGSSAWIDGLVQVTASDVWAWGSGRSPRAPSSPTLLHFDGHVWSAVTPPRDRTVLGLAARGGHVMAAAGGELYEHAGSTWRLALSATPGPGAEVAPERVCMTRTHVVVSTGRGALAHRPL